MTTEDVPMTADFVTSVEAQKLLNADVTQNIIYLERAVADSERRLIARVLRTTSAIRRRMTSPPTSLIDQCFPFGHPLLPLLFDPHVVSSTVPGGQRASDPTSVLSGGSLIPEVECYLSLLTLIYIHDQKDYKRGLALANTLVERLGQFNRRGLDAISARIYFYYVRLHEYMATSDTIRPVLLAAQRTAALRHDLESQAMLINLLLRNYLSFNLVEQADKLVSKSSFPDDVSNGQVARYMYYLGRIKAIQLDYTASHQHLQQAIRKVPANHTSTAGFLQAVQKLSVIVQLLMGDIPERGTFGQPMYRKSLLPYRRLTEAVRVGDLTKFQNILAIEHERFLADRTYTLILRLRHNVIKAGIRMISLSYSRISLKDICLKLHLDSEEDAEYIVGKAIRDGVIDAVIDHENGYMKSKENIDVYSTNEPQKQYHGRITFCLNLHNEIVRAMRYPLNAHRKDVVSTEAAAREREREIAKELAEGELDDDDDMADF